MDPNAPTFVGIEVSKVLLDTAIRPGSRPDRDPDNPAGIAASVARLKPPAPSLIVAAADVTSIHATCPRLDGLASEETIRKALYASLPEFAELQRRLNAALACRLPRPLRRRPQRLAINLNLIPDHGEPFRDETEVDRSLARDGPSYFHAYATAYVILKSNASPSR